MAAHGIFDPSKGARSFEPLVLPLLEAQPEADLAKGTSNCWIVRFERLLQSGRERILLLLMVRQAHHENELTGNTPPHQKAWSGRSPWLFCEAVHQR